MGTGYFPGVKRGRGVTLTPDPLLVCHGHERVELYLYSPYGPYGLYRASVPVQGALYLRKTDISVIFCNTLFTSFFHLRIQTGTWRRQLLFKSKHVARARTTVKHCLKYCVLLMVLSLLVVGNLNRFPIIICTAQFTVHDLKENTQVRLCTRLFLLQSMYWISCCLHADQILPTDDGLDRWSRNVGKKLPLFAAW
jgi:hypothetical protein